MATAYTIKCSGCPRTYNMNLQTIATKPKCLFCGASLNVPDELLAEAKKSAPAAPVRRTSVSAECFVCARALIIKPEAFGRTTKCTYCTAPLQVASDGAVSELRQSGSRKIEEELVGAASCPSCRQKKLQLQPDSASAVRCAECAATADLADDPLEMYFPIARPGKALMTDFARMALQARWSQRRTTLTEASQLLDQIGKLDAWAEREKRPVSPFDVQDTAEIIQYAIVCNSSAMSNWEDDKLMLIFPMRRDAEGTGAPSDGAIIGLLAARPRYGSFGVFGAARMAAQANESKETQGDPAICLLIKPYVGGSELAVISRDAGGNLSDAPAKLAREIDTAVRGAMLNAARQFLAFKAIFGAWANGEMLYGSTAKGLQKRLESLGGVLSERAAELGPALQPKPALKL